MVGTVVSNKMDKTVVVKVERLVKSKLYHKYIRRRAKFAAHDEGNACQIGDKVVITESQTTQPIQKMAGEQNRRKSGLMSGTWCPAPGSTRNDLGTVVSCIFPPGAGKIQAARSAGGR